MLLLRWLDRELQAQNNLKDFHTKLQYASYVVGE